MTAAVNHHLIKYVWHHLFSLVSSGAIHRYCGPRLPAPLHRLQLPQGFRLVDWLSRSSLFLPLFRFLQAQLQERQVSCKFHLENKTKKQKEHWNLNCWEPPFTDLTENCYQLASLLYFSSPYKCDDVPCLEAHPSQIMNQIRKGSSGGFHRVHITRATRNPFLYLRFILRDDERERDLKGS